MMYHYMCTKHLILKSNLQAMILLVYLLNCMRKKFQCWKLQYRNEYGSKDFTHTPIYKLNN